MDKTKQSHTKSRQNNLHSVHSIPCAIYEQSGPQNKQHYTTHGNAPKGSGSYLRTKTHIQQTHSQHLGTLTAIGWGKQKETLMATYKSVMSQALEYASSIWAPLASSTSISKLQVMQNSALRTATGCTQDTNIQHLHYETLTLPIHEHLQLHASHYKQKTQHSSHPLHKHKHTTYFNTTRLNNFFNNGLYTTNIPTEPHVVTTTDIHTNIYK